MKILRTAYLLAALLCAGTLRAQEETPASEVGTAGVVAAETPTDDDATPEVLWDKANTAYLNGDFRAAAATYERLLAEGFVSEKLYYNLANARFKEERLGEAILYYLRAQRLAPGDEDIRHNLGVAQSRTKDRIEEIPRFFLALWMQTLRHTMSATAWAVLSLVLLAVALTFCLVYLLARRLAWRKAGFYGTLTAAVLFVVAVWCAAAGRRETLDTTQAVVMAPSAAVKSSPDRSSTDLFVLHEGTEVRITDRLGEWCEIVIGDGKKGWVETRKIEVV